MQPHAKPCSEKPHVRRAPTIGNVAVSGLLRGGFAVMLDTVFGCLVGVATRLLRMAMRDERLMRCVRMVVLGVVSRGLAMVHRGLFVMGCRRVVMLRSRQYLDHGISPM